MKELGISFSERVIMLDRSTTKSEILQVSPSGRVPCLKDGEIVVWDSLAVFEYLAELNSNVWPKDKKQRAWARSVCAEMHSGFSDLRKNLSGQFVQKGLSYPKNDPGVIADIARIREIWRDGLSRWGGPFLCGDKFSAVDAMYAPVALGRFVPYGVTLDAGLSAYVERLANLESSRDWVAAATIEAKEAA